MPMLHRFLDSQRSIYNKLWAAHVPRKVLIFMWRVLQNALLSYVNLWRQKVSPSTLRARCDRDCPEDISHALFTCSWSKEVRLCSSFSSLWLEFGSRGVWDAVVFFFFKYDGGSKFHLFLIICWFLWWDQNVWIAEGVQLEPYFMVAKAETFLLSYKEVHETLAREVIRAPVNWVKLSDPWIQINTDAALSLFSLGRGFGMVGRDSCWTTLFAKTSKCFSSVVVNVAKAMSIFVAVEEAIFCGFSLVEIENDSLLVV